MPSIGDLPSLHQGRQKDELEKPHPSPLTYDPKWVMARDRHWSYSQCQAQKEHLSAKGNAKSQAEAG